MYQNYNKITPVSQRRSSEHIIKTGSQYTKKYNLKRLVYLEETSDINLAIAREKQLKNWHRQWKINLIESANPNWDALLASD